MQDFNNKVAVITGGAGGVGKAIGMSLSKQGANIVVADIEATAIDAAVADIQQQGGNAIGVVCDVAKLDTMHAVCQKAVDTFGDIHLVFANAGVATNEFGTVWGYDDNDWNWMLNVNVWGVINTMRAFMPRLMEQGIDAHFVVSTSANGGVIKLPYTPIYTMTKAAALSLAESLYFNLKQMESPVKVSAYFPGPYSVDTGLFNSGRNRPDDLPEDPNKPDFGMSTAQDMVDMMAAAGIDIKITSPEEAAEHALDGIRQEKFWILPLPPEFENAMQQYHQSIQNRTDPEILELDG